MHCASKLSLPPFINNNKPPYKLLLISFRSSTGFFNPTAGICGSAPLQLSNLGPARDAAHKPCSDSALPSSTSMRIFCIVSAQQTLLFFSISLSVFQASSRSIGNSSSLNFVEKASSPVAPLPLSDSNPSTLLISPEEHISNVVNASSPYAYVECNGRLYGRPIAASCLDAWRIMPGAENTLTFADRSQEISSDVALPWRFPSCEHLKYAEIQEYTFSSWYIQLMRDVTSK